MLFHRSVWRWSLPRPSPPLRLPMVRRDVRRDHPSATEDAPMNNDNEQRPILIVDDTPEIRALIADTLTDAGYTVECAGDGAEALAAVEQQEPALVLLDLHMPVLDGWGFARVLTDRDRHVPIVVLTAAANAARNAAELGAVGYIRKPFALLDL